MGASFVKSCFGGEASAELAAHREARRRYERRSQLLGQEEARASSLRRSNLQSAASFGSDKSLADLAAPRVQHPHHHHHHSPAPIPAKPLKKKKSQAERGLELPRTAVRLQQLRASSRQADQPEDELPPVPIPRGDDWAPRKPRPSAKHAVLATSLSSDAGTITVSESSFSDDCGHLFASPPRAVQSPPSVRNCWLSLSDARARSPAALSFRALLPEEYALECVVGKGTTSTCYRCMRQTDGRRFACKIIEKRRLASSPRKRAEIADQLRREVEVLCRVDHPHIAKLEEAFENDSFLIIIMELLEGGELFDAIVEKGRFSEPEAVHVARSVLSAMKHMHDRGIVHRDLKPENMLLAVSRKRRAGGCAGGATAMTVKIIDFGFAKVLERGATSSSFLGTGGYLAPEILLHQPYAAAVDMWSFGVLVYLLLCGRLPFAATTQLRPNQKVSALYKLSFPRKYWNGVSPLAVDFLQRVLVLNPSTRLTPYEALSHPWLRL